MTDNEIIKVLEICTGDTTGCGGCPLNDPPSDCTILDRAVLDLIKRQQAEIEGLKRNNKVTQRLLSEAWESIEEKDKWFEKRELIAKSEAITEFAERLKEVFTSIDGMFECWEIEDHIENLVKEMTEGDNGE